MDSSFRQMIKNIPQTPGFNPATMGALKRAERAGLLRGCRIIKVVFLEIIVGQEGSDQQELQQLTRGNTDQSYIVGESYSSLK